MSYQRERDAFLARVGHELGVDTARKLLRAATTLDRLAVAQCNGDWPADNGERKTVTCPQCNMGWAPSTVKRTGCPDCRATAAVHRLLTGTTYQAVVQGDPRGYVLHLYARDATPAAIDDGSAPSIGVPVRS